MRRESLRLRLILASSIWIFGSLLAAGFLLMALFRAHIENRFDQQILAQMVELVAAAEPSAGGRLMLGWTPSDSRFAQPFSGWYWQITSGGETLFRSRSLWRDTLQVKPPPAGSEAGYQTLSDAERAPVRAVVQSVTMPGYANPLTFAVAGPAEDIRADVDNFTRELTATLAVLALSLIGAVVLQVRFGLSPLRRVREALGDIRSGESARLPEDFPEEIQPVVSDFNALLDQKEATIERAREEAGDLAHALKTPLAVIGNEAQRMTGERGKLLRDYTGTVSAIIQRHLSRRRAAAGPGTAARVAPVLEDLASTMRKLYPDRTIRIVDRTRSRDRFAGDTHDLEEMLANLLDNACKWSRGTVSLTAAPRGETISFAVEDDGPGMSAADRKRAMERGKRLDTSVPGSGIGLSIVSDLARLYGGTLGLGQSRLGGLAARLRLPAVTARPRRDRAAGRS